MQRLFDESPMRYISCMICVVLMGLMACNRRPSTQAEDAGNALVSDTVPPSLAELNEEEIAQHIDTAAQETIAEEEVKYEGAHIYISKSKMKLYVLDENDSLLFSCGIACGARRGNKESKGDYRTPEGKFKISAMYDSADWIHYTKDGRGVKGCYGPHFLRLSTGRFGGIGIHGTNAPRSIGRRASEGCIRVLSENIVTLYDKYVYQGMPVEVAAENAPFPACLNRSIAKAEESKNEPLPEQKADSIRHPESVDSMPERPSEAVPADTLTKPEHADSSAQS